MASIRCQVCNGSGSNMLRCGICNQIWCANCARSSKGNKYPKYSTTNKCPYCGKLNEIYYIDYNNGKKKS